MCHVWPTNVTSEIQSQHTETKSTQRELVQKHNLIQFMFVQLMKYDLRNNDLIK